jgi:hypothetical protein
VPSTATDLAFLTRFPVPQHHAVPPEKAQRRSRTEEARGSNPLTSTPQQPWSPAWRVTSTGPASFQLIPAGSKRAATCLCNDRQTLAPAVAGRGRAFGACCCASKLRSPAGPALAAFGRGGLTPTSFPTRRGGVPLASVISASVQLSPPRRGSQPQNRGRLAPLGGVERPRRKERFARLIHRRVRAFGPAFGRRRLRRQSQSDLAAIHVVRQIKATRSPMCHHSG